MENIYSEEQKSVKTVRAAQKTVNFLLAFSKSIHVVEYKDQKFELTLN